MFPQFTACAPLTRIVLPKRGLCPKESNKLGATGVHFEAWDFQDTGNHPRIRVQEQFFRRFCNADLFFFLWFHPKICANLHCFWDEDLFLSLLQDSWKSAHTSVWRPFFGLLPRILQWTPSLCGPHSRIQSIKVFVPPKFVYASPFTLFWHRARDERKCRIKTRQNSWKFSWAYPGKKIWLA